MASSIRQELKSIQEEVNELSNIMSRIQQRLTDVTRISEEDENVWQARVVELETQNNQHLSRTKRLSEQNAELERQVSRSKPEVDGARDARDKLSQKLRNARKVIQDLVDEKLQADPRDFDDRELNDALREALTTSRGASDDANSDRTVRVKRHSTNKTSLAGRSRLHRETGSPSPPQSSNGGRSIVDSEDAPSESVYDTTPESSLSLQAPSEYTPERQHWKIHYSKPPASAQMSTGSISYNRLLKYSVIEPETVELLQSLDLSPEFGLRLQLEGNVAFIYDPIFLEGPSQTYILDWATQKANENAERYIKGDRFGDLVFHTFVFQTDLNKWYYVGAHAWVFADMWPVWSTLGGKSKQKLLNKLNERCHGQVDEQEIMKRLDEEDLKQFCVEISSISQNRWVTRLGPPLERREMLVPALVAYNKKM